MRSQWDALLCILPLDLRKEMDKHKHYILHELRLRVDHHVELVTSLGSQTFPYVVTHEDIRFCVNSACKYSPWSAQTFQQGYITAPGGHRIGICGTYIKNNSDAATIKDITSICIRISRDLHGISNEALNLNGSTLIIGSPGSGKTTFLRDYIRQISNRGHCVCVVDERQEIFPVWQGSFSYDVGMSTDVISNCSKGTGIELVLRSMGPEFIAVDEITAEEDAIALLKAGWCGVSLIATAHAYDQVDLYHRPVYEPIIRSGLFDNLIIMQRDKSWTAERMTR